MHRFIKCLGGIVLLSSLTGCDVQLPSLRKQKPTVSTSTSTPTPVLSSPTPQLPTKTHKVTVTVTTPADIKVKVGETVLKSQLIVDSATTRKRLVQQRLKLQQQLQQVSLFDVTSIQPNTNLLKQQVQDIQKQLQAAQEQLQSAQTDLIKFKQDSAYTAEAWDLLATSAERQALQDRKNNLQTARQTLANTKARLATAQQQLQAAAAAPAPPNPDKNRTKLQQQLNILDQKLKPLKTVLSPVTGVVKTITPKKTKTSNLSFELAILATESPPLTPGLTKSPSLTPGLTKSPPLTPGRSTPVSPQPLQPGQAPTLTPLPFPKTPSATIDNLDN